MTTSELRRGASVNGQYLRFADVLRWAEKTEIDTADDYGSQEESDAALLVGYLLYRAAIDLCGRGGVVINRRVNTWSRDGRNEDIEVTVGVPIHERGAGPRWVACRSYWLYSRAYELEPAAKALDVYRRYRKAERDLYTEQVEVDYAAAGGGAGIETRRFWIAYQPHIAGYADDDYRISHASGSGKTKTEALLAAIEPRARRERLSRCALGVDAQG